MFQNLKRITAKERERKSEREREREILNVWFDAVPQRHGPALACCLADTSPSCYHLTHPWHLKRKKMCQSVLIRFGQRFQIITKTSKLPEIFHAKQM